MVKPANRSYSRYAREAATLLGLMIRNARVERGITVSEIAERAGVSRGLVHRIERGEMTSSIGASFEVAAIVGLHLFDSESPTLTHYLRMEQQKLALLPRAVRTSTTKVKDDF